MPARNCKSLLESYLQPDKALAYVEHTVEKLLYLIAVPSHSAVFSVIWKPESSEQSARKSESSIAVVDPESSRKDDHEKAA